MGSRGASAGSGARAAAIKSMSIKQLRNLRDNIRVNLEFNTISTPSIQAAYEKELDAVEKELKARKKK